MKKPLRFWYGLAGLLVVLGVVVMALGAPRWASVDPDYGGPQSALPLGAAVLAHLNPHPGPLGNPELWSRLVWGTRWTLLTCLAVAAGRLVLGLIFGALAGLGGRAWKVLTERAYLFATVFPPILLSVLSWVVIRSLIDHTRMSVAARETWKIALMLAVLVVLEAPRVMVAIQGRLEQLQQEPFYEGAVAVGNTRLGLLRRHLLPHLAPTLATQLSGEFARALVTVATLGALSIYVLGTRVQQVEVAFWGRPQIFSGLLPDWGGMIAENLYRFRLAPEQTIVPATAVAVLVLAVSLLSDGLDPLLAPLRRPLNWLKATVRTWVWGALVAAAVAVGVLAYYQGLPWGRAAAARQFVTAELQALTSGDRATYLEQLAPNMPWLRQEQAALVDRLQADKARLTGRVQDVRVDGAKAIATLQLTAERPDGTKVDLSRSVLLERRWGAWHDRGPDLYTFRSRLATLQVAYPGQDPSIEGMTGRAVAQVTASLMDRTLAGLLADYPQLQGDAPLPVTAFTTPAEMAASVGLTPQELGPTTVWYQPGESLRISTHVAGMNEQVQAAQIRQVLLPLLVARRQGQATPALLVGWEGEANPVLRGPLSQSGSWLGAPLLPLDQLLRLGLADFQGTRGWSRALESVALVQWIKEQAPGVDPRELASQAPDALLQSLATSMKLSVPAVQQRFWDDLLARLRDAFLWSNPQAQQRWPADLVQATPALLAEAAKEQQPRAIEPAKLETQDEQHALLYALVLGGSDSSPTARLAAWAVQRDGAGWHIAANQSSVPATLSLATVLAPKPPSPGVAPKPIPVQRPDQVKLVPVEEATFTMLMPEGWERQAINSVKSGDFTMAGPGLSFMKITAATRDIPHTLEEFKRTFKIARPTEEVKAVQVPGAVAAFEKRFTVQEERSDAQTTLVTRFVFDEKSQVMLQWWGEAKLMQAWDGVVEQTLASYRLRKPE